MRKQEGSTNSPDSPPLIGKERSHILTDVPSAESLQGLGPSAFEGTAQPFFARLMGFSTTDIRNLELLPSINEVDSYIMGLVKSRNWVDTKESYKDILKELRTNLGLHRNLEPLRLLELLRDGVRLLRLQADLRQRDADIQKAIKQLNARP